MCPKINGDHLRAMELWHKLWITFRWLKDTIHWVGSIALNATDSDSLFAGATDFDADDVDTCLRFANLQDDEKIALLRFAMKR